MTNLQHFKAQADALSLKFNKPVIVIHSEHAGYQVWLKRNVPEGYEILYDTEEGNDGTTSTN